MQTKLLTIKEVAARLNVSVGTIRNWINGYYQNSRGPRTYEGTKFIEPVVVGNRLRFKESEFNRWVESRSI